MAAGERARARRRLRASAVVGSTLISSIAGLAMFGTLSGFSLSDYFLSNYTQHHGILDSGTISNVSNTRSDRGSWSATVQIALDRPVGGATSTTLTVGNAVNSPDGTPVTVLVDPQDPAHAEYPGRPASLQAAVIFLSFTGVLALLFIFAVWRLAVIRFRNRGLPPPPVGRHRYQHGTRASSRVGGLPPDRLRRRYDQSELGLLLVPVAAACAVAERPSPAPNDTSPWRSGTPATVHSRAPRSIKGEANP